MSEIQTSDFIRALNSTMCNLENAVGMLLGMLENVEKLESSVKSFRCGMAPNERELDTEEIKQLTNDATISAESPHQETSGTSNEIETATNGGTNPRQSENEIQGSVPATVRESDASRKSIFAGTFSKTIRKTSSKSNDYILAVALAIFGIIIAKLFFILFT